MDENIFTEIERLFDLADDETGFITISNHIPFSAWENFKTRYKEAGYIKVQGEPPLVGNIVELTDKVCKRYGIEWGHWDELKPELRPANMEDFIIDIYSVLLAAQLAADKKHYEGK